MRKFILFTSTLAVLGLGLAGANAYDAADDFGPSVQNDLPPRMKGDIGGSDAGLITSGTGKVTAGYPTRPSRDSADRVYRGYNASDDFSASY